MRAKGRTFTVTHEHLTLLRHANVGWNEGEWGAPGLDTKRPFGNGDLYGDMRKILGIEIPDNDDWDPPEDMLVYLNTIYGELETVLQIFLKVGRMGPGEYRRRSEYGDDWEPKVGA